jgi:hypothetical protein
VQGLTRCAIGEGIVGVTDEAQHLQQRSSFAIQQILCGMTVFGKISMA